MPAVHITDKRLDLLRHLGEVTRRPGGTVKRWTLGRFWTVDADMRWLVDNGLAEVNPDDADLDVYGFQYTADGRRLVESVEHAEH